MKDGSSLYCVLGVNKSYVKQSLVTLFLKNCTEEDRANHRKALKELVNDESIIDVSKEEPIIEAALSNEKEKEYLRLIYNMKNQMLGLERRNDINICKIGIYMEEIDKETLTKCNDRFKEEFEKEEEEDEINIYHTTSKKILGEISYKELHKQYQYEKV